MPAIKVEGLKELDRMLKALPERAAKNAIAAASRAGGKVVVKSARDNLDRGQFDYPELKASIKTKVRRPKSKFSRIANIGPTGDGAWLQHIVEYGTLGSRTKPLAPSSRRKVAHDPMPRGLLPVPFMRNALTGKEQAVSRAYAKKLRAYIDRQFKKLRR